MKKDVTVDQKYFKDLPSEAVDYGGLSLMIFEFPAEVGSYNRDCASGALAGICFPPFRYDAGVYT